MEKTNIVLLQIYETWIYKTRWSQFELCLRDEIDNPPPSRKCLIVIPLEDYEFNLKAENSPIPSTGVYKSDLCYQKKERKMIYLVQ